MIVWVFFFGDYDNFFFLFFWNKLILFVMELNCSYKFMVLIWYGEKITIYL